MSIRFNSRTRQYTNSKGTNVISLGGVGISFGQFLYAVPSLDEVIMPEGKVPASCRTHMVQYKLFRGLDTGGKCRDRRVVPIYAVGGLQLSSEEIRLGILDKLSEYETRIREREKPSHAFKSPLLRRIQELTYQLDHVLPRLESAKHRLGVTKV